MNLKKNIIEIDYNKKHSFLIKIGFNGTDEISEKRSLVNLESGRIIFRGRCTISAGCTIGVSNGGVLEFGEGFSANKNFFISCNKNISFGKDAMIGWNVTFFDANGHPVLKDGILKENSRPIVVGNHVWIGSESHVLKGTHIPNNTIIAYGSFVTTKLIGENCIYGGNPARHIQSGIEWKRYYNEVLADNNGGYYDCFTR